VSDREWKFDITWAVFTEIDIFVKCDKVGELHDYVLDSVVSKCVQCE
jgi:hypothetical protein